MIRRLALALCGFLLAGPAASQELRNGGFEQRDGSAPAGWYHARQGYDASLLSEGTIEGERCLRLAWVGEGSPPSFGNVFQTLDAQRLRGHRLRFRMSVRVEGEARAQLWFRVDREDGSVGFFDNMESRPITSRTWGEYEIVGDVARDAFKVHLGILLIGAGTLVADRAQLEVVGDAPQSVEASPPSPLTERGLANVVAFARLFGMVRYFHPSDEASVADWDRIAVGGAAAVESAGDASALARILEEIFHPIAPSVSVFPTGTDPGGQAADAPAGARQRARLHHGYFRSSRVEVAPSDPSYTIPRDTPLVDLGGGVSARVPLMLLADEHGTLPRASAEPRHWLDAGRTPHARDRASRLGAVVVGWNIPQHFYPYFDVIDGDWLAELRHALSAAALDEDEPAFLATLRRMVAALDDGHARVQHEVEARGLLLPVQLAWVAEDLVVVAAREGSGLAPGDILLEVDGVPVRELARRKAEELSAATPQWTRVRLLTEIVRCTSSAPRTLSVRHGVGDAEPFAVELRPKAPTDELPPPPRPQAVAELEAGIWYVDTTRFDGAAYREALPSLAAARGLVFDFRGYPGNLDRDLFFSHLSTDTLTSPEWHVPVLRRPDRAGVEFLQERSWVIPPEAPFLSGRKAFLIDGRAISFAESCMGIVEAFRLGDLVGEATAGTNGNVCNAALPGGYEIWFTGLRVLKHGGLRHHGVGILPTVAVQPTVAGIAAGRDEVLERALEQVRE